MPLSGSIDEALPASAGDVFAVITDVERLPEWNAIIRRVFDAPASLSPGAEWVVELSAMGNSWRSRSRVLEHDPATRRFAYRSQTDDDNPSYGDWRWAVLDCEPGGCRVTVAWDLHPETFWRRVLFAPVRNRQLRREVRASLRALAETTESTSRRRATWNEST